MAEALARQPGLTVVPSASTKVVVIEGELRCCRVGPTDVLVDETYDVRLEVPSTFPRALPRVNETAGRIPRAFHRNPDNTLCLGSPIAQWLKIRDDPTLDAFLERVVVPYLYGHAFYTQFGSMPFGELAHGAVGLADDVRCLFGMPARTNVAEFLRLASLKRRYANKLICPCGHGRRVGRCHHEAVHDARRRLGRATCRAQRKYLLEQR